MQRAARGLARFMQNVATSDRCCVASYQVEMFHVIAGWFFFEGDVPGAF